MDQVLDQALNLLPILVFAVIVWYLVYLQRQFLEKVIFAKIKEKYNIDITTIVLYKVIALRLAPLGTAIGLALLIPQYPLFTLISTAGGETVNRIMSSAFIGIFAGYIYNAVKDWVKHKTGVTLPGDTDSEDVSVSTDEQK